MLLAFSKSNDSPYFVKKAIFSQKKNLYFYFKVEALLIDYYQSE